MALVGLCVFVSSVHAEVSKPGTSYAQAPSADRATGTAIRPFSIHVPQAVLNGLHRRLDTTRWPDAETVTHRSHGVQLATMRELVRYWQSGYDWRKVDGKLNDELMRTAPPASNSSNAKIESYPNHLGGGWCYRPVPGHSKCAE
jgi:hypothetical protein